MQPITSLPHRSLHQRVRQYSQHLGSDIPAGVVVFLVALPLCLGIALASGAPLLAGLISGVIGGLVVAALSGSQLSVSGPAAGLVVIVVEAIATLGGFSGFLVAVILAGVLQILFGFLRAGDVGSYVPTAVIKGMLAAIGILLIIKQLPVALGFSSFGHFAEGVPDEIGLAEKALHAVGIVSGGTVVVAAVSLALLALWETQWIKRQPLLRSVPGPLLVVMWGVLYQVFTVNVATEAALAPTQLVQLPVIEGIASLFGQLDTPDFSILSNQAVYTVALTLAVVASLETLLSLEAVDKLDPMRRVAPSNRELYAQGAGNVAAGFLGGLPLTAVIVRSSANINAGGRTKVSAVVHGLLLLGSVLFLSSALRWIPLAALSAILLHVGYKLAKPALFVEAWRRGITQAAPFAITVGAILVTDLLVGIGIGMAVGLVFVVRTNFRSALSLTQYEDCYLLRMHKDATFFNKAQLRTLLARVTPDSTLIIDASRCQFVDHDIEETIADYMRSAPASNITVTLRAMPGNDSSDQAQGRGLSTANASAGSSGS